MTKMQILLLLENYAESKRAESGVEEEEVFEINEDTPWEDVMAFFGSGR